MMGVENNSRGPSPSPFVRVPSPVAHQPPDNNEMNDLTEINGIAEMNEIAGINEMNEINGIAEINDDTNSFVSIAFATATTGPDDAHILRPSASPVPSAGTSPSPGPSAHRGFLQPSPSPGSRGNICLSCGMHDLHFISSNLLINFLQPTD